MENTAPLEPRLECPTSGVLLGAIVKAFALDDPAVGGDRAAKHLGSEPSQGRRAREQFRGGWVADQKRREICAHVVRAALHAGLLRGLKLPQGLDGSTPEIEPFLTGVLTHWLDEWDYIYHRGASGWPYPPRQLGGFVLGRQVVIDLALRVTALIQLMGGSEPEAIIPFAGDDTPGRALMQALMKRSGQQLTREALASKLGVEKSTVDDWIDENTVPREENIQRLAEVFATEARPVAVVLHYLRIQFGLIDLRNRVETGIGSRWARELFAAFACMVQWTLEMHSLSKQDRRIFLLGQVETLLHGARFPSSYWVLNAWLKVEEDQGWIDDIIVAQQKDAAARLQECFEVIGDWPRTTREWDSGPKTGAMPVKERREHQEMAALMWMSPRVFAKDLDHTKAPESGPATQSEYWSHLAKSHMAQGEHDKSLPLWVKAIEAEPANADHHCHYGISLWHARPSPEFDEALSHLRKACDLRPEWDYPVAEIARVYLHRGWTEHALQVFESAPKALVEASQDCSFTLALTLHRLKRFEEARQAADRARQLDPTHADAWSILAECAFELGDKVQGGKAAREALRLGQPLSYDKWMRPLES